MRNFFGGVMSEANEKLQLDAMDNPDKHDIEALTGDESQVSLSLSLSLSLSCKLVGYSIDVYLIRVEDSSSGDKSYDSTSDDEEESSDDNEDDESNEEDKKSSSPDKISSMTEEVCNMRPKKRPKIVELS
ncbi:hypothetical protein ACLB2K_073847 [Fragaria x ananassa]